MLESKLGNYKPPVLENENVPEEIIPNFEELKVRLDVKSFEIFAIEWMTNQTEKSYELFKNNKNIDSKIRKSCKSKYNKQKMAISTFKLFMDDIPEKPSVPHELGQWKGLMTISIKKGIEKCKKFVKVHKLRKDTKRNDLTVLNCTVWLHEETAIMVKHSQMGKYTILYT